MSKIALLGVLMVLTACVGATSTLTGAEAGSTNTPTVMNTQNWTVHTDPAGFAVEIPRGWRVTNEEGRINVTGPNAERVTIFPLSVEGRLDESRAQGVLIALSQRFWPRQRWAMPSGGWQFGAGGVRAVGADQSALRETTALWWTNTPRGAFGFFYGVAAEPARFDSLAPTFARVLASFRVTRAEASGGQRGNGSDPLPGLQFRRWADPNEDAYSTEVPAGWGVGGGTRLVGMYTRIAETVVQSPDGQVIVRDGDVSIPYMFMEPNQMLATLGQSEGQWANGNAYFILRFMPALQFATDYVQRNVGRVCGNIRWLERKERPDYVRGLASQGALPQDSHYTAAQVTFTCQSRGGPMVGYLFVTTSLTPNPAGNLWNVQTLHGFLAPPDRAAQADAVLVRMLATTRMNPEWWARVRGSNARVYEEYRRTQEYTSNLLQQMRAEREASWDRLTEQRGDVLSGHTRVVDPQTGQAYRVRSGSNYYWIDPVRGVVAGTDLPYRPTWDFTEMIQTYR